MKVTVCFGPVKIVVPCGDGQITVQELIDKSVARYRKATGKSESYWIHVKSLGSQGEGGILDTDDLVCDVADDREKLTAIYEEQDGPNTTSKYIGDGTSTCNSSVGTGSPIMLETNHINNSNNKYHMNHSPYQHDDGEDSDEVVVVTGQEISAETKLHVRRGSDPIMPHVTENGTVIDTNANTLPAQVSVTENGTVIDTNANTLPAQKQSPFVRNDKLRSSREELDIPFERNSALRSSRDELSSAFQRFGRDSSRRSLASNNALKWAEAQQKVENQEKDIESSEIEIPNDGTPLGIHIIARVENDDGSAYGLVVHGIEDGGRAARDGRLRPGDHIKTINGINITQETFDRAQEIMREAMKTPTVKVEIEREKVPPLILPESPHSPQSNGPIGNTPPTPPPKSMPVVPLRSPTTALSANGPVSPGGEKTNLIAPTNTRRIGRKLYIQLMKGPQGLGFSITTRDNPTLGKNPIYIKNILPKGAAISDGRLKQGDRLLEVNGIEMTGKNQTEAVSILRSVKLGGVVNLIVSRQESPVKELPRQLKADNPAEDPTAAKNKQILTFNIGLNDTGSAGLGVSVKGKTSGGGDTETKDLGIFIKSVIHGGAASKDGRLRPNDQLLCINDTSLLRMSNSEAMETLRRAMSGEKSPRSAIQLIIARRFDDQKREISDYAPDTMEQDMEWDRSSIQTPDVEAQLEQADELLNHPLLNSFNTNSLIEGRQGSSMSSSQSPPVIDSEEERMKSPTLPSGGAETVMIEETDIDHVQGKSGMSSPRAPSPPNWLINEWEKAHDGEMSPLPDPEKEFSRDNRARLSFSERRQGGSLDAKQMAWYKKTKEKREEREEERKPSTGTKDVAASTGSLVKSTSSENVVMSTNLSSIKDLTEEERREIGPGLGLKKSSSLESLQAAVAEVTTTEEFPGRPRAKVVRGRGCNESFRAAVDRSYDMPMNGDAPTSEETGMTSSSQGPNGLPSVIASDHSSVSSMEPGMNRTNSKRKSKDKRKSGGVFKGLGSMFRFGKNRKDAGGISPTEEDIRSHEVITTDRHNDMDKYKNHEDHQNIRIHQDVHRLRDDEDHQKPPNDSLSKSERMQQLREQYQQRHRERQGRYVDDDLDDDLLDGREVDRYGRPSPRMPKEQRGSPHSHSSLPDTNRSHHSEADHRRDHREHDYRQERNYEAPEKPMSNGYRNERERHEHDRTRESDPHVNKNKEDDDDEGGFVDSRFARDDGRSDRRKESRAERREDMPRDERREDMPSHDRDEKYRSDRSHDGRQREHRYDDKLYEERYRQANHGDRHERHRDDRGRDDRGRDDRGRDPRYRQEPHNDRGDRTYERWNGRPDDRRDDRRHNRREDRSREYLDQREERHDRSRDQLNHGDRAESSDRVEKEQLKESEKSEKDKSEEKQLKRRESERSIKSSKFSRRASDRSKNKNKDKDKGTNKTEEPPKEKIEKEEKRHSIRRGKKGDKKEDRKDEPEVKDKSDVKKEDETRREEFRNDRRDDRRDDRKDERYRRRDDPRERPPEKGDHRHRPEDGRYDPRDPRYSRDRRGPPPPPDRYGYQSLERSHHRRPRQEPPNKYYNTAPREVNSSDSERPHPRRVGGGGDAPQYSNHYPNDQSSSRPYANGPSTSHRQYEKPRGGYDENNYYGNSGYGSLRKHRRDERDYYDREISHYDAAARV
ncbi:partitioning defective 3 homolog [Amphiura filiformis]|uniref:partitioning defective 3 homolog n=1 Tax=Amphiura filiformis TaxID=82378 RepID=UPI003B215C1A